MSVNNMLNRVEQEAGTGQFDHPFFTTVQQMLREEDHEAILKEQIPLKLLRLMPEAQDGFVLSDFPRNVKEAELMEQFRGGMNAFVHVSLPDEVLVDIEESKVKCTDCGKVYYKQQIISDEHGVRIEGFMPEDGHCDDCGSTNFEVGSDPADFEEKLNEYKQQKEELLAFYNHYGLLVDYEVRQGYESYDKLKRSIQYNIKH